MLVSLNWLKNYVSFPDDVDKLVHDMTMAGLNVERVIRQGIEDPNVVVGYVTNVEPHPNADRLRKCRVKTGEGDERDIVCGAPNVAAGQHVFVALPGAHLPNGLKIRKSKIRGEVSEGMICSEPELGLGDDADGIMVLEGEPAVGTPIGEVLGSGDVVLEVEVTPNRPDQLSHVGIARELSAIYGKPMEIPYEVEFETPSGKAGFEVEIENPEDCTRFVGKLVTGVKVGPSPAWLSNALQSIGLQSISNVVDVTNFVLMETGQPIHAYDYHKLKGPKLIVRRAESDEKLLALDGKTYDVDEKILIIADARDPVGLAGIMGGEESAVHEETVDVLIEAANFHPTLVRRGRNQLAMSTDASYRFERGADREMCRIAAERAAQLIMEIGGGEEKEVVDLYVAREEEKIITVRRAAVKRILGARLSAEEIAKHLTALGFTTQVHGEDEVSVSVPSFRRDIDEEIDLIEEVARIHGYDRLGQGWEYRSTTFAVSDAFDVFKDELSDHLVARGFSEVVTTSFTDGRELTDFGWDERDPRRRPIPIRNPLSSHHTYLKTSLLPGMLDVVRYNIDRGARRLRLYQTGRVYVAPEGGSQLPTEIETAAFLMTASEANEFWNDSKSGVDLFDIKREVEVMLEALRVDLPADECYDFDVATGSFSYSRQNKEVIGGGVLSDPVAERYDFDQPIWYAIVDIKSLYDFRAPLAKHRRLGEFPVSKRDLSLVAAANVGYGDIEKSLVKSGGRLLESVQVFDVYRGEHLEGDRAAYGVRLIFRSPERTLTDREVDDVIDKMLSKLKTDLSVELRT